MVFRGAQVNKLKMALAAVQDGVDINNRVTQPLNQRFVTQSPGSKGVSNARDELTGTGVAGWVLLSTI